MSINPETFDFLKNLAANNNREWFQANRGAHDKARENVIEFAGALITELNKMDPGIDAHLDPAKCVMRIYRDLRFSLDKTPYKNHFIINKLASGKTSAYIGYYMHVQPGASFISGGGGDMFDAGQLKAIRQEIDYDAGRLKSIIDDAGFKKLFGEFRERQVRQKTVPQEYSADNENIELLKLKSFAATHNLTDAELMNEDAARAIASICSKIYPLCAFLNKAIG